MALGLLIRVRGRILEGARANGADRPEYAISKTKKMFRVLTLGFLILLLGGCDGNYKNVQIEGLVSDKVSGRPIHNAKIVVKCWVYDTNRWESQTVEKSTITDKNGRFGVNFNKGEALDVVVTSDTYREYRESITLEKNAYSFDIKLALL